MIENNLNNELFEKDDVLKEEFVNNNIVDSTNLNVSNEEEHPIIETLDENIVFTPVVSDGILEDEILSFDVNQQSNLNESIEDKHDEIIDFVDNSAIANNQTEVLDESEEIIKEDNSNYQLDNNEAVQVDVNNIKSDDNSSDSVDFSNLDIETNNNENFDSINNVKVAEDVNSVVSDFTKLEMSDASENEDSAIDVQNIVPSSEEVSVSGQEISSNENNNIETTTSTLETTKNNETLLEKYGENYSIKKYVCNPAIGRDNEIKQLILTLLTPEKSGILVGKPGIGKTAIVEGLGYQIQKGNIPDALKDYQIYKLNTSSLLGLMPGTSEPKIQVLLNEIKGQQKLILFIDEIHTLIGAGADGDDSLDFANIFKPGLDRGNIKIIGATTSDEYDKYILTDKAFVRRFQKIDVLEPTKEHTVKILMGSLPKLEYKTGAKLKYTSFIQEKIMTFIVDLTTEYRRVYELAARYPDVALTILQQAFSYAVFDNKKEVGIRDVRKAIANTKLVYPDVIKKELVRFNDVFSDIYLMETPQRLKGETSI